MIAQRPSQAAAHAVATLVGLLNQAITQVVDGVGVISGLADQGVGTAAAI